METCFPSPFGTSFPTLENEVSSEFFYPNASIDFALCDQNKPIVVRSTLLQFRLDGPFGQFRNFQRKSRKNGFFGRLETQNCRNEDFWRKTRAFIILAPLRNDFILRFQVNGMCPEEFSVKKKMKKNLCCLQSTQSMFEHPNLNLYEK